MEAEVTHRADYRIHRVGQGSIGYLVLRVNLRINFYGRRVPSMAVNIPTSCGSDASRSDDRVRWLR